MQGCDCDCHVLQLAVIMVQPSMVLGVQRRALSPLSETSGAVLCLQNVTGDCLYHRGQAGCIAKLTHRLHLLSIPGDSMISLQQQVEGGGNRSKVLG